MCAQRITAVQWPHLTRHVDVCKPGHLRFKALRVPRSAPNRLRYGNIARESHHEFRRRLRRSTLLGRANYWSLKADKGAIFSTRHDITMDNRTAAHPVNLVNMTRCRSPTYRRKRRRGTNYAASPSAPLLIRRSSCLQRHPGGIGNASLAPRVILALFFDENSQLGRFHQGAVGPPAIFA